MFFDIKKCPDAWKNASQWGKYQMYFLSQIHEILQYHPGNL